MSRFLWPECPWLDDERPIVRFHSENGMVCTARLEDGSQVTRYAWQRPLTSAPRERRPSGVDSEARCRFTSAALERVAREIEARNPERQPRPAPVPDVRNAALRKRRTRSNPEEVARRERRALALFEAGRPTSDIAANLGVSYAMAARYLGGALWKARREQAHYTAPSQPTAPVQAQPIIVTPSTPDPLPFAAIYAARRSPTPEKDRRYWSRFIKAVSTASPWLRRRGYDFDEWRAAERLERMVSTSARLKDLARMAEGECRE